MEDESDSPRAAVPPGLRTSGGEKPWTVTVDQTGPAFDELLARPLGLSLRKFGSSPLW